MPSRLITCRRWMPDALTMNSSLDFRIGGIFPAVISRECAALCWRANSLKDSTSSSLEIVSGGTKSPVPLMAVLVTPCYPGNCGRKLSQRRAKRNPLKTAAIWAIITLCTEQIAAAGGLRHAGSAELSDRADNEC